MDINAIITNNEDDVDQIRSALVNIKGTLQVAAYDYAHAALSAASEALKCVQEAAPCVAVWTHIIEYRDCSQKAQAALGATAQAVEMLLVSEETGDDYLDDVNAEAKVASVKSHVVAAMLEGATLRINIALQGVPENGAPGQLCNPKALSKNPPPED